MSDPTYYLDINGISKHIGGTDYDYNEDNPGFGVTRETEWGKAISGITGGYYKNSFSEPSYYAGGHLAKRFGDKYYADLGVTGGLISGYGNGLTAMGGLFAQLGKKDLGRLQFRYVPSIEKKQPALWMMNMGIPFK